MEAVRPGRPRRIHDKDGSLGGGPNSYILIHDGVNDSIAVDTQACEIKPTWNAAVCKGDVGRLTFGGGGGGGRGAGPGWWPAAAGPGAGAGRGAPGAPVQLPLLALLPALAKAQLPVPAQPLVVLAQLPVLADLVVEPVLQHLLSRQSFSAAMARSSP